MIVVYQLKLKHQCHVKYINSPPTDFATHSDLAAITDNMVMVVYVAITQLLIQVVISELGKVEHELTYKLTECLTSYNHVREINNFKISGNNAMHVVQQMFICWEETLYKCTERHSEQTFAYINKQQMCGVLNTGKQLDLYTWKLQVYSQFGVIKHHVS